MPELLETQLDRQDTQVLSQRMVAGKHGHQGLVDPAIANAVAAVAREIKHTRRLSCPHCGKQTFLEYVLLHTGPFRTLKCRECNGNVRLERPIRLVLVFFAMVFGPTLAIGGVLLAFLGNVTVADYPHLRLLLLVLFGPLPVSGMLPLATRWYQRNLKIRAKV